jgi:predicted enzyme related to lactoylglutathione lyase
VGNPVVHFEVVGRNAKRLQAFYGQAFDWEVGTPSAALNDYAIAKPNGNGGIDGGIGGVRDEYDGHVTFYVQVPNLEKALQKIGALGGRTLMPPETIPGGTRFALFADPEGHAIGLVEKFERRFIADRLNCLDPHASCRQ